MIFGNLIIALLGCIYANIKYKSKYAFQEYLLQFVIAFSIPFIIYFSYTTIVASDIEYWGDSIISVEKQTEYYSYDWESNCFECGSYDCNCSTDDNNIKSCDTCCESCYVCNYHPERYYAHLKSGRRNSISKSFYNKVKNRFNVQELPIGIVREGRNGCGINISYGYITSWDKQPYTAYNYVTKHRYENKVVLSSSVYKPYLVSKETYPHLLEYPDLKHQEHDDIIGYKSIMMNADSANQYLKYFNGEYGIGVRDEDHTQIKFMIWVFNDEELGITELQKHYLKNGNKNEFNVILNVNSDKILEYDFATWCEVPEFITDVEKYLFDNKESFDLLQFVKHVESSAKQYWKRTEFSILNDLITIDAPFSIQIIGIIVNILLSLLLIYCFSRNQIDFRP